MAEIEALKKKIAVSCRVLHTEGHHDYIWGHVSARRNGNDTFWMKPSGFGFNEINSDDLVELDLEGNQIGGNTERKKHLEYPIHSEIYRLHKNVNCVIHTHPFYATMLSALQKPIEPLMHDGCLFVDNLVFYNNTSDLIVSSVQGEDLARSLGNNIALLMRNHGVVITGESIEEATGAAVFLERAAKAQIIALMVGEYVCSSRDEVKSKMKTQFSKHNYNALFAYFDRIATTLSD